MCAPKGVDVIVDGPRPARPGGLRVGTRSPLHQWSQPRAYLSPSLQIALLPAWPLSTDSSVCAAWAHGVPSDPPDTA